MRRTVLKAMLVAPCAWAQPARASPPARVIMLRRRIPVCSRPILHGNDT
jgi:hypothetical protein